MNTHKHLSKTETIKVILYLVLFLVILYLLYYLVTKLPSSIPIPTPTAQPTYTPAPTTRPTSQPTIQPTIRPTSAPTTLPTIQPTPSPTPFVDITPSPTVPFVNNFLGVWKYNMTYSYVFDNGYRWFFYNGSNLLNYGTYQLVGSSICNITITNQMNTNDSEEWGVPKRMSCLYQSSPKTITNTYILQTLNYDSITNPYPTPPVPTEPPSGLPTTPPAPTTAPITPVPTTIPPLTPPPVVIATQPPSFPSGVKSDGVSCYDGHDGPACNDLLCLNGGSMIYSNPTINDTGPYCTCLGNYDPSTNCAVCSGTYDITTNCSTCINKYLDVNSNCTQCSSGSSGKKCSAINCGTGTAIVTDITSTNGTCSCPTGFDQAYNCSQCLPGRSGKNCSVINCGIGKVIITDITSTNGTCSCPTGFDPATNCTTCISGFGGPNCTTTCANGGTANTNPNASTVCTCTGNFNSATNCSTCLSGYGGPNCTTTCANGGTPSSNPNASTVCSCTGNFNPATNCTTCISGYAGPNCTTTCANGGTANTNPNASTVCTCIGYFNPATNCNQVNCNNGTLSPDGLTCSCATGWIKDSIGNCMLAPSTALIYYPRIPTSGPALPSIIYRPVIRGRYGFKATIINTPPANPPSGYTLFNWSFQDMTSVLGYSDNFNYITTTTTTNDTFKTNPDINFNLGLHCFSNTYFPDSNGKYYFRIVSDNTNTYSNANEFAFGICTGITTPNIYTDILRCKTSIVLNGWNYPPYSRTTIAFRDVNTDLNYPFNIINDIVIAVNLNTKQFWVQVNNSEWNFNNSLNNPSTNLGGVSFSNIEGISYPPAMRNNDIIGTTQVFAGRGSIYNTYSPYSRSTYSPDLGIIDGIGTNAAFGLIYCMDIDYNTGTLYVADGSNNNVYIRKITSNGTVTTLCSFPIYYPAGNTNIFTFSKQSLIYNDIYNALFIFDISPVTRRILKISNLSSTPVISTITSSYPSEFNYNHSHNSISYNRYNGVVYLTTTYNGGDSFSPRFIFQSYDMVTWTLFLANDNTKTWNFRYGIARMIGDSQNNLLYTGYNGIYKINISTKEITLYRDFSSHKLYNYVYYTDITINPSDEIVLAGYSTIGIYSDNINKDAELWANMGNSYTDHRIVCDSNYNIYAVYFTQRSIIKIKG